jgi:Septum formation initiator
MSVIDEPRVSSSSASKAPAKRPRSLARTGTWSGLIALVLLGLGALALLPTRAWLNQRTQIADAQRRLAAMQIENERMAAKVAGLQQPDDIAKEARSQFNLVRPNEASYAMLPAPLPTLASLPAQWPYTVIQQLVARHR